MILFLANTPWFGGVKEEEYLGATAAKKKVVQVQARLKNAFIVTAVYEHLPIWITILYRVFGWQIVLIGLSTRWNDETDDTLVGRGVQF
jgi:hypothetical protein